MERVHHIPIPTKLPPPPQKQTNHTHTTTPYIPPPGPTPRAHPRHAPRGVRRALRHRGAGGRVGRPRHVHHRGLPVRFSVLCVCFCGVFVLGGCGLWLAALGTPTENQTKLTPIRRTTNTNTQGVPREPPDGGRQGGEGVEIRLSLGSGGGAAAGAGAAGGGGGRPPRLFAAGWVVGGCWWGVRSRVMSLLLCISYLIGHIHVDISITRHPAPQIPSSSRGRRRWKQ